MNDQTAVLLCDRSFLLYYILAIHHKLPRRDLFIIKYITIPSPQKVFSSWLSKYKLLLLKTICVDNAVARPCSELFRCHVLIIPIFLINFFPANTWMLNLRILPYFSIIFLLLFNTLRMLFYWIYA